MNEYTKEEIAGIVERIIDRYMTLDDAALPADRVPVEVSGRHVHLSHDAVEALFGKGAALNAQRPLSQPGQFLSDRRVQLVTHNGMIPNVAVLGPERGETQVEISRTDARTLGVSVPVNLSGDLHEAADVLLVGPEGCWHAKRSAIAARAHIHLSTAEADLFGLRDGETVGVHIESKRPVTLEQVIVRVGDSFAMAMHIDADEANACALEKGMQGRILREPRQHGG